MTHPAAAVDHAPLLERAFPLDVEEQAGELQVEGRLPPFLSGTCCWNGPGVFGRGGVRYRHWLDGDGMVCALRIEHGRARVRTRFVRNTKFREEEAAGKLLFRTFGTAFAGDRLRRGIGLESPANVSVYHYGPTLLAFAEQGLPWELDPDTLETRGPYTFSGQLNDVTPFSAHPKFDHRTGEMFNFGVAFSNERPMLNLFRFDPAGTLVYRKRVPLPYPASIHDFALSESYAVFHVGPFLLDMGALLEKGVPLIDALSWQPERGSQLLIVSRETGALAAAVPAGDRYCLHLVNAFEREGRLHVDLIEYERPIYDQYQVIPSLFTDVPRAKPLRLVLEGERLIDRRTLPYECAPDFPAHDVDLTARPYSDFWMLGIGATGRPGRKFFDQLVRLSWDTGTIDVHQAPVGRYLGGEPLFVPDPVAPETGVVLCQAFDAESSCSRFLVFDAATPSAGPIATLTAPALMPLLFHSSFYRH